MGKGVSLLRSSGEVSYKLVIPGRLHSLNQYIDSSRRNQYAGAKMKRDDQHIVEWHIRSQLRGVHIHKPVWMYYTFYEPNKKRDHDNVSSFARKVCQDALVTCKVLENDGWGCVTGYTDSFDVDKKNPRIEVVIKEE